MGFARRQIAGTSPAMTTRLHAVFALAALGACQTPCPSPNAEPVHLGYHCNDGSQLQVTFSREPDNARVVQEGYTTLDLPARSSGSGFRYADNGAELQGRRSEVRWIRPGAAETVCRERR